MLQELNPILYSALELGGVQCCLSKVKWSNFPFKMYNTIAPWNTSDLSFNNTSLLVTTVPMIILSEDYMYFEVHKAMAWLIAWFGLDFNKTWLCVAGKWKYYLTKTYLGHNT